MLPTYRTRTDVFNYDEIPAGYYFEVMRSGSPVQRFWHRRKFEFVAKAIKDGERVLDLGCGPGSFLQVLGEARPGCSAVGVDIASPQIEFARQNVAPAFPDGRVSFRVVEPAPAPLPFEDGSFDVVTCIEVIEHIHPYLAYRMLAEARRVLKPSGRLYVTTPNYRSLWPLIELGLEYLSPVKYHEQHINRFTPNALVKFLECAGFEVGVLRTFFGLAPFLAGVSWGLASTVDRLERRFPFKTGSLMLAEVRKAPLF